MRAGGVPASHVDDNHQSLTCLTGLEVAGLPIGSNDLLIAAHASALGATVVMANVGESQRVPGLNEENWLA
jgi:predicted nucleic acid-binding protein